MVLVAFVTRALRSFCVIYSVGYANIVSNEIGHTVHVVERGGYFVRL